MTQTARPVILEPAARQLVQRTSQPPYLQQLGPEAARAWLDEQQSTDVPRPEAYVENVLVPGGPAGPVPVRIVRPTGVRASLPAVLYVHGGGWVLGNAHTHDRLVRELVTRSGCAVVFPEYSRSPEARFPTALEECYAVARWLTTHGAGHGVDDSRISVAGDSVGGTMATVLTMMARQRGGPRFRSQVLLYPATDADFDTESYRRFAEGHYLRRDTMMWFWDQYLPDRALRADPMAVPLRADLDQLRGLPPALVLTNEADVLRDEGEAYAARLREAGVHVAECRYQGAVHDLVMLDALAGTDAARAATAQAAHSLRETLQAV
jgi:acetyl esterase